MSIALNIKWNKGALKQLGEAIFYIENDSYINAQKVRKDILLKIDGLLKHPESHSLDKFKIKNDGSFRAFEIHSYRISYRYQKNEIRIIRLRHTKMNPLGY